MPSDRARLLLHPVRMRIVMALSADDLTTRELQHLMPEVPQASLYRAASQLARAGVIEVVKEERRGGAMERTYRAVPGGALMTPEDITSGTSEEFLATVQTFADLIVQTTGRYVATEPENWSHARYSLRQETFWLTPEERAELAADLQAVIDKYADLKKSDDRTTHSLMVAVVPEVTARLTAADLPPDLMEAGALDTRALDPAVAESDANWAGHEAL